MKDVDAWQSNHAKWKKFNNPEWNPVFKTSII
jgi:hypothetical protein